MVLPIVAFGAPILRKKCKGDGIKRPNYPAEIGELVYKLIKDRKSNFKNLAIDGGKIKNLA